METPTHPAPPVDLDRLVSPSWAIRFFEKCPTGYKEAIRRAGEPVEIYETDETGEVQWAITLEDGFWMDALPTKEEAESLVAKMGWPIIGANKALASGDLTEMIIAYGHLQTIE
jgi:hypothetical protein